MDHTYSCNNYLFVKGKLNFTNNKIRIIFPYSKSTLYTSLLVSKIDKCNSHKDKLALAVQCPKTATDHIGTYIARTVVGNTLAYVSVQGLEESSNRGETMHNLETIDY